MRAGQTRQDPQLGIESGRQTADLCTLPSLGAWHAKHLPGRALYSRSSSSSKPGQGSPLSAWHCLTAGSSATYKNERIHDGELVPRLWSLYLIVMLSRALCIALTLLPAVLGQVAPGQSALQISAPSQSGWVSALGAFTSRVVMTVVRSAYSPIHTSFRLRALEPEYTRAQTQAPSGRWV